VRGFNYVQLPETVDQTQSKKTGARVEFDGAISLTDLLKHTLIKNAVHRAIGLDEAAWRNLESLSLDFEMACERRLRAFRGHANRQWRAPGLAFRIRDKFPFLCLDRPLLRSRIAHHRSDSFDFRLQSRDQDWTLIYSAKGM
jgi:hypothetical protein